MAGGRHVMLSPGAAAHVFPENQKCFHCMRRINKRKQEPAACQLAGEVGEQRNHYCMPRKQTLLVCLQGLEDG